MGILDLPIFGTPKDHAEEKEKHKVVETPEFDITQYAKKLGVIVPTLIGAVLAGLKATDVVKNYSDAIVVASIGLAAVAILGICLISAVDLAARAFLAGPGAAQKKEDDGGAPPAASVVPAPRGMLAWIEGSDEPHPVLAIAGDGEKASSYLIADGGKVAHHLGGKTVEAIDGAPKWTAADKVRSLVPSKWS